MRVGEGGGACWVLGCFVPGPAVEVHLGLDLVVVDGGSELVASAATVFISCTYLFFFRLSMSVSNSLNRTISLWSRNRWPSRRRTTSRDVVSKEDVYFLMLLVFNDVLGRNKCGPMLHRVDKNVDTVSTRILNLGTMIVTVNCHILYTKDCHV